MDLTRLTKHIPVNEVIVATSQPRVLDFDTHNAARRALFQNDLSATTTAGAKALALAAFASRANKTAWSLLPVGQ